MLLYGSFNSVESLSTLKNRSRINWRNDVRLIDRNHWREFVEWSALSCHWCWIASFLFSGGIFLLLSLWVSCVMDGNHTGWKTRSSFLFSFFSMSRTSSLVNRSARLSVCLPVYLSIDRHQHNFASNLEERLRLCRRRRRRRRSTLSRRQTKQWLMTTDRFLR